VARNGIPHTLNLAGYHPAPRSTSLTSRHCERSLRSDPRVPGDCFVGESALLAMTGGKWISVKHKFDSTYSYIPSLRAAVLSASQSKDERRSNPLANRRLLRSLGLDTASEYLGLLDQRSLAMTGGNKEKLWLSGICRDSVHGFHGLHGISRKTPKKSVLFPCPSV